MVDDDGQYHSSWYQGPSSLLSSSSSSLSCNHPTPWSPGDALSVIVQCRFECVSSPHPVVHWPWSSGDVSMMMMMRESNDDDGSSSSS